MSTSRKNNRKSSGKRTSRDQYGKLNTTMKKKLAGLFIAVVLAFVALSIRITVISAKDGKQYARSVLSQTQSSYSNRTIPYQRGNILDSNGNVLATSRKMYNVILDCSVTNDRIDYYEPTIEAGVSLLGLDENEMRTLLVSEETKEKKYCIVRSDCSIEEKQAFEEYINAREGLTEDEIDKRKNVQGIWFEEKYIRTYPFGSLACDVIGFTNSGDTADWGIEGYYNNTLNGVNGRRYGYYNEEADIEQIIIEPVNGETVVLTLDANIQQVVEKNIQQFMDTMKVGEYSDKGARNVGVIIMNPNDGSVYSMASSDPYDLNNPRDLTPFYAQEQIDVMNSEQTIDNLNAIWRNFCISDTFEPGSTFKPICLAAALEDGSLSGTETYVCDGSQVVAGTTIRCSNTEGHGEENLSDVIRNSCNDGMMQIVTSMGIDEFAKYQQIFNFGARTGIDISGEAEGILHTSNTMGEVDLATGSFGQGFTSTMIQEAAALCSVINGGSYYQPHLVSRVLDESGRTVRSIDPILKKQTISEQVSGMLRNYMQASVDNGTSVYAKVDGYSSGGKTGTSQKIPRGNGKYTVSFIGFWPAQKPQVLCYVVVDEPNAKDQANSAYAQVLARQIMTEVLPYMGIFADETPTGEEPLTLEGARALTGETVTDTNVPGPENSEETLLLGNNEEMNGYTNEEAGLEND